MAVVSTSIQVPSAALMRHSTGLPGASSRATAAMNSMTRARSSGWIRSSSGVPSYPLSGSTSARSTEGLATTICPPESITVIMSEELLTSERKRAWMRAASASRMAWMLRASESARLAWSAKASSMSRSIEL